MTAPGGSPWFEFFLTPSEKDHFAQWNEVVNDRSMINPRLGPVFDRLALCVPENVAPNVLTLAGSFAILQAWYFCQLYVETDQKTTVFVSVASILAFWICGGLDGKHAKRTMNDTSLGELFKYVCDLISSVFLVVLMCDLLLVDKDFETQWYCVQSVQVVMLLKHYSAFQREAPLRYIFIGPGELIAWSAGLLMISGIVGIGWLKLLYEYTVGKICSFMVNVAELDANSYLATMAPARATYVSLFVILFVRIALTTNKKWTRNSLMCILALRTIANYIRMNISMTSERDVIFDGLFTAMITSDLIVGKMANRELHTYVVVMASMVILPHFQFLIACFVAFYLIAVFGDLMNHMNLPLLQVCRNVYCDGIYDLCHVGHKKAFHNALKLGNRLKVGVVGDKDANAYKRPPVMTAAERESEVMSCKCVTEVIRNAPCFGITKEFIDKHRIHICCYGQEYQERFPDPDDDPYYKVPRKMGIARPLPRSTEISTSELIARIQSRAPDEKKSPT